MIIEMTNGAVSYFVDDNNKSMIEEYKNKGFVIVESKKEKKVKPFGGE